MFPIPRASNLGFLGLIPTRLIAHHLLQFPTGLTAVFSAVMGTLLAEPVFISNLRMVPALLTLIAAVV